MKLHYSVNTARVLGLLLMPFSATMLPPVIVALWYHENTVLTFSLATATTFLLGFLLWFPFRKYQREIHGREAFLIAALLWAIFSLMGSLPFIFAQDLAISNFEAVFETISGLTTTGSTILSNLQALPRSILYYRQQLQFVGGGGIIVLGIAILPMLGIGGMQLFRAEITGPFKEEKIAPRVTQAAKTLWYIYVGLMVVCAAAYWAAGMSVFDAISYSFSTISTGGFGPHNDNFGFFKSPLLEALSVFFMLLGSINFSLHFAAIRRGSLRHYWQDPEFKTFIIVLGFTVILTSSTLFYYRVFETPSSTIIKSLFHVTSFITTTGLFSTDFGHWPSFVPFLLLFICLLGGCAGSTAGGIKMIRLLILRKQSTREIQRLIHPDGHYLIKLGNSQLHTRTLDAILGFFCIYVATFVVMFLLLMGMGLTPVTAFSALAGSISNTGLGLVGAEADNVQQFGTVVKGVLAVAMLAGRLELFTLLVLLTPSYWRY